MLSNGWSDYPTPRPTIPLFFPSLSRSERPAGSSAARDADRRRREQKRWVWEVLSKAEQLWSLARLAKFLVFLYDGKYRTLIDRMLRMRLTYAKRAVTRNVSFEFLNRQLVWEAFTVRRFVLD
jgi:peroxin-2